MNAQENVLLAQSRADSYKLLSQCFYLPDENLLALLKGIQLPVGSLWMEFADAARELDSIAILEVDYSMLFVGPFKLLAPPYESVYEDNGGQIAGDSTVEIRNVYLDEGIDVSIKEVPDHISIELEFMYYLISEEISAIHEGADDKLQDVRNKQLFFLNEFLSGWISQFCSAVRENSRTDFYTSLSNVTETFILNDLTLLEQEMENLAVHSQ